MRNNNSPSLVKRALSYCENRTIEQLLLKIEAKKYGKDIGQIIEKYETDKSSTFFRRWQTNRYAYFPRFWKNHFHIKKILQLNCLSGEILDFGCGTGHIDIELAKKGKKICGIDISPTAIAVGNYYKSRQVPEVKARLELVNDDITSLLHNRKFGSCIMTDVMEHLEMNATTEIIGSLKHILQDGAKIFISVPLGKFYCDIDHCNFYHSLDDFNRFCKKIGLDVVFCEIDYRYHVIDSVAVIRI